MKPKSLLTIHSPGPTLLQAVHQQLVRIRRVPAAAVQRRRFRPWGSLLRCIVRFDIFLCARVADLQQQHKRQSCTRLTNSATLHTVVAPARTVSPPSGNSRQHTETLLPHLREPLATMMCVFDFLYFALVALSLSILAFWCRVGTIDIGFVVETKAKESEEEKDIGKNTETTDREKTQTLIEEHPHIASKQANKLTNKQTQEHTHTKHIHTHTHTHTHTTHTHTHNTLAPFTWNARGT
jgi:hypothetical protein